MSLTLAASLAGSLPPVRRKTTCKVCGEPARLHGVVDYHRTCEVNNGTFFELSGIPIWYHRCTACGFLFTEQFDQWSPDMFRTHIYNDDYVRVDPESVSIRATQNAGPLLDFLRQVKARRVLDYGGGNGMLAKILRDNGIDATSWDPMEANAPMPEAGAFDVVTAYEVLEHTPTPLETCRQATSFLNPRGLFVFSTGTGDGIRPQSTDVMYIAPRNGHISIHTTRSLELMLARVKRKLHRLEGDVYLAFPHDPGG